MKEKVRTQDDRLMKRSPRYWGRKGKNDLRQDSNPGRHVHEKEPKVLRERGSSKRSVRTEDVTWKMQGRGGISSLVSTFQ